MVKAREVLDIPRAVLISLMQGVLVYCIKQKRLKVSKNFYENYPYLVLGSKKAVLRPSCVGTPTLALCCCTLVLGTVKHKYSELLGSRIKVLHFNTGLPLSLLFLAPSMSIRNVM